MKWRSRYSLKQRLAYWAPRFALAVVSAPLRLIPGFLRRVICLVVFSATAQQQPRSAMRLLLAIDEDLAKWINHVAVRYDGGVHVKHRLTRYHDFFVERISPGERVLDLGCGYGAVAYSIASRTGAIVTAIDLNHDSIAIARKRFEHPNLAFIQGDFLRQLPADRFDVIVMSNVLEHLEQRVEFLAQVQATCHPQRWLLRVPLFSRDWKVPLRQELGLPHFSDPTHFVEYTREEFNREMQAAGLAVTYLEVNWGEIWAEVSVALSAGRDLEGPRSAQAISAFTPDGNRR